MEHLFVIEAPGKIASLKAILSTLGVAQAQVVATMGHVCANPDGLRPISVDASLSETAYRIKADREDLAHKIRSMADEAEHIHLAMDEDHEGDVIARDVFEFVLSDSSKRRADRVYLKAMTASEVERALTSAEPIEPLMAARGDARRILDRLIGGLSNDRGAVGRVQGSLLVELARKNPIVGMQTHVMPAADGGAPFVAKTPVYGGQEVFKTVVERAAETGSSTQSTMALSPWSYHEILLGVSLETQAPVSAISSSLQKLYERGSMTYPRTLDKALTASSLERLSMAAKVAGTQFNEGLFKARRGAQSHHAHESPNPLLFNLPVNQDIDLLELDDQVLGLIGRQLMMCGMPCTIERPALASMAKLPESMQDLPWHRMVNEGYCVWRANREPDIPGYQPWNIDQSLIHFMASNNLGRPSTMVNHLSKFIGRKLSDHTLTLNEKGLQWHANVHELFTGRNISAIIDDYIDSHIDHPAAMVREMVSLCGLDEKGIFDQTQQQNNDRDWENDSI